MHVAATSEPPVATPADTVVVGAFADAEGDQLDLPAADALLRTGEARRAARHLAVGHLGDRRVIVVGLGSREAFDAEAARQAAAAVQRRAGELGARHLAWGLPAGTGAGDAEVAEALVTGTVLAGYRFTRYRPTDADPGPARLTIAGAADPEVARVVERAAIIAAAQNRARDLGNRAPNDLTPAALADYALALADRHPALTCEVLDEAELRERGMGAFAAVAQGSAQPARLITLRYEGPGAASSSRLALIGKAVTFDSGGLTIKTGAGMVTMKFDMAGGAAVIETMAVLAQLSAPSRVLAVVGATENMIDAGAMRPGDVLAAYDGTTIEMTNTDAEGRLVLADCITHALREGADALIDIATLTGGVVSALGSVYAGLMGNDDALAELVADCGERTGELAWRLPLHPAYAEMTKGRYAQLSNRPEPRGQAAAITAAAFLNHFAGSHPWAHLDIAGVGDDGRASGRDYLDKGATGFGVRLLTEVALSF